MNCSWSAFQDAKIGLPRMWPSVQRLAEGLLAGSCAGRVDRSGFGSGASGSGGSSDLVGLTAYATSGGHRIRAADDAAAARPHVHSAPPRFVQRFVALPAPPHGGGVRVIGVRRHAGYSLPPRHHASPLSSSSGAGAGASAAPGAGGSNSPAAEVVAPGCPAGS